MAVRLGTRLPSRKVFDVDLLAFAVLTPALFYCVSLTCLSPHSSICPSHQPTPQAVLNSDSESVLIKGLRRFASHIRREHGILPATPATTNRGRRRLDPNGVNDREDAAAGVSGKTTRGDPIGQAGETEEMEVDSDLDEAGTDKEEADDGEDEAVRERGSMEEVQGGTGSSSGSGHNDNEGQGVMCDAALLAATETGEAPGQLGEYLRGSPQVNDLLALWDLDARKVGGGATTVEDGCLQEGGRPL